MSKTSDTTASTDRNGNGSALKTSSSEESGRRTPSTSSAVVESGTDKKVKSAEINDFHNNSFSSSSSSKSLKASHRKRINRRDRLIESRARARKAENRGNIESSGEEIVDECSEATHEVNRRRRWKRWIRPGVSVLLPVCHMLVALFLVGVCTDWLKQSDVERYTKAFRDVQKMQNEQMKKTRSQSGAHNYHWGDDQFGGI